MPEKDKKSGCVGKFIIVVILTIVAVVVGVLISNSQGNSTPSEPKKNPRAEQALSYLSDIEEIKWVEIDNNNAYIGFDPLPSLRLAARN